MRIKHNFILTTKETHNDTQKYLGFTVSRGQMFSNSKEMNFNFCTNVTVVHWIFCIPLYIDPFVHFPSSITFNDYSIGKCHNCPSVKSQKRKSYIGLNTKLNPGDYARFYAETIIASKTIIHL